MPRSFLSWLLAAGIGLALLPGIASAQAPRPPGAGGRPPAAEATPDASHPSESLLPADAVTTHTITVQGRQIAYTARAGALALTDDQGEKTAEIFYIAYTLDGASPGTRPVTFAFNGGPGAGSAYLQMGAIGPRVLDFGDGRSAIAPGGKVIDNPDTWLPFTDLVFIDPVGTGYSHAMNSVKDVGKEFWGVRQDIESLNQTIRLALAKLDRFGSPVYLAGESYGGYRAAKLVQSLPANQGIAVAGATMISPVLEFSLLGDDDFDPLDAALRLPSYAAVNLEAQGKLSADALAGAEQFALGDYLATLAATPADPKRLDALYATIAADTGLPEALVARWRGKVPASVFTKEIRHDQGQVASNYDGSVDGGDPYPSAPSPRGTDPVFENILAPLTTAFVSYVRNELQFKTDRQYELLNNEVSRKWDWQGGGPSFAVGASDDLRRALATNPKLKITIDHGMTDLVTPYMTSRYVIDHLPPALTQGRVTLKLFAGGHMIYLRPDSRAAVANAARAMYGVE